MLSTASPLVLTGNINGAAGLTLASGNLTLGGSGSYGGPTVIAPVAGNTLTVNTNGSLPAGTDVTVPTGTTLAFANGLAPTVGSLTGGGTVSVGNATTLTVGSDASSGSFRGTITGTGGAVSLVKNGAGLQVLAGTSALAGAVTVNGGTLQVSPSSAANPLGNGTVTLSGAGGAGQATLAFRQVARSGRPAITRTPSGAAPRRPTGRTSARR